MTKRKLEINDILRLIRVGEIEISGRGDIAYTLSRADIDKNRYEGEIRILWRDGTESYYFGKDDSTPRWSPDGNRLAFISRRYAEEKEKGSGIYVVGKGGEPRKVAWFKHGVSEIKWLDNRYLIALASTPVKDYDEDGDYVETSEAPLWFDRYGLVAGKYDQLYKVDVESGRINKITDEKYGVYSYEILGKTIYYTTLKDWMNPLINILKKMDVGGEPREILSDMNITSLKAINGNLYFLGHKLEIGISSHSKLFLLYNEMPECLTCDVIDRDIYKVSGPYKNDLILLYPDQGRAVLSRYSSGALEPIVHGDFIVTNFECGSDFIVYVASYPDKPMELYKYSEAGIEQLTHLNDWLLDEVQLYKPIHHRINSVGEDIDGWVIKPDVNKDRLPFILYIHGGPKGMYGYGFYPEMQLMASKGFIVGYCNPHGSEGYSEEFADIRGRYGDIDYKQIMDFVNYVVKKYPIDTDKTAVTGISYGGYMTNWIITNTDFFKAAVSENGIADWIADFWASDIGYWFDPDQIGGTPIDNIEEYIRKSPAFHVSKVKTPVLLIHSMHDYRCFIDQSLAMHIALKMMKRESKLVVFRKGSHGHSVLAEPRHRRKRYEIKLRWLGEKLGLKLLDEEEK